MGTYVPISLIFMALYEKKVPIIISAIVLDPRWDQLAFNITSNSSLTPLNLPFMMFGGRHCSSVSSLSVGSVRRYSSVV